MNKHQHPSNNSVLGAPPGVAIEDCSALPITRITYPDGIPAVRSYWKPDAEELARLAAGQPVYLEIFGVTHAPLYLGVAGDDRA